MKKIFIILALLILIVLAVLAYMMLTKKTDAPETSNQGTLPLSQAGASGGSGQEVKMNLRITDGTQIPVRNFLASAQVQKDLDNSGYYSLGYQGAQNSTYRITYIDETNYFNIVLLAEPLGASRTQAENYLMNTLGISKEQMCLLDYTMSVPNAVNTNFSGENLGFSFCPNAVKLP